MEAWGEEAENTLWEIFLEIIYAYQGNKYRLLPGLIAQRLHFLALKRMLKKSSVDALHILDAVEPDAQILELADTKDLIALTDSQNFLEQLLAKLTEKQRDILTAIVLNGYTAEELSKKNDTSLNVVYVHLRRALAKIKSELQQS